MKIIYTNGIKELNKIHYDEIHRQNKHILKTCMLYTVFKRTNLLFLYKKYLSKSYPEIVVH
jgi:hypothetical protein